jgi:hypothetical protein
VVFSGYEFQENRPNERHALFKFVNGFIPVLSMFVFQFGVINFKKYEGNAVKHL